jgi:hypothetical protein
MRLSCCLLLMIAGCALPPVQVGSTTQPAVSIGSTSQPAASIEVVVRLEPGSVQVPVSGGGMTVLPPPIPESTSIPLGIVILVIGAVVVGTAVHLWHRRRSRKRGD